MFLRTGREPEGVNLLIDLVALTGVMTEDVSYYWLITLKIKTGKYGIGKKYRKNMTFLKLHK